MPIGGPGVLLFLKPPILPAIAAALIGLPPGAQLSDSAPQAKYHVQCDIAPNIAIRQAAPSLRASQWSDSAPVWRFLPADQVFVQPLTLGIKPLPATRQLDQSAPASRWIASFDVAPNLSVTTLQPVQAPFIPIDTAQWQGKYQVTSDVFVSGLLYPIQPTGPCWNFSDAFVTFDNPLFFWDCSYSLAQLSAGGGLLPGRPPDLPEELGRGMGPYKRPGQVFGEPDPISPRLSSRAPDVPRVAPPVVLTQVLPFIELPTFHVEQVDEDTAVFALVALEELCGSDPLRGPITLHIVRRKV